jgi:hypothetical protein
MEASMPERPGSRRFIVGSPFKPAAPAPPAERYVLRDQVNHDRYGLGRVIALQADFAVVVDFGPRLMRIRLPCARMTKL